MTAIVQVAGVTPGDPVVEKIAALYHAAFPPAERVPFPRLLQHPLPGYTDGLWAFTHNGQFCGFMTTITRGILP
ncbi:hypothetical protein [Lacticaseibacillus thailandensis]|uniref:hypothetical protein n=1 Tax=Lacticaseibacillus thailandensis TaxID=381741 RepID=UPI0012E27998|nr:hypothetical protein [Lacticaseibacillus thailandensis]